MATRTQSLAALDTLSQQIEAALQPGANLPGPALAQLLVRTVAEIKGEVARGGQQRYGAGVPAASLGLDGDVYTNTANGYEYAKVAGAWVFQLNKKGAAATAPQKGVDYFDGVDGADGNAIFDKAFAPPVGLSAGGQEQQAANYQEGDQWFHTKGLASYDRYAFLEGQWRLVFRKAEGATTPPPSATLAAGLTISAASATVGGTGITYAATASGGTGPYSYLVQATNANTGGVLSIGPAASGSWSPPAAGSYDITATVTDSAGASKVSAVRRVEVTAPVGAPLHRPRSTTTR
ncbi:hypothetical protein D0N36_06885 [Hymenobacter lapidiphilus]|uniref:hypothetical protein n=1 Tax=Hymenobacter sp. CCM 8763 TaxID=2303334 RepID=UPI000E3528B0|nr:hypothetical protein [Hymenobacter sp. CCM 8763]RFP65923.1 hypothetical protein D0N36_06885 [Hymenobacter sp. CCM 8763]